jgi:hypothetical protein
VKHIVMVGQRSDRSVLSWIIAQHKEGLIGARIKKGGKGTDFLHRIPAELDVQGNPMICIRRFEVLRVKQK